MQRPLNAASPLYRLGIRGFDWWFGHLSTAGWLSARLIGHRGIRVMRNIPYGHANHSRSRGPRHHRLDVYCPPGPGPHPLVFYVHGGGFSILSKDTHWMMAMAFAQRGLAVANVNYRLAPRHPFPAALEDVAHALAYVQQHAAAWGADANRLILAGESAGANLVTALAVALCYERPEPYAKTLFAQEIRPAAVVPACGILQVTDPGRFRRRKPHLPALVDRRIHQVARFYLGGAADSAALELASPLVFLERGLTPARPLPPFFIPVGTRDPLLDDSRRLGQALTNLGVAAEVRYYPGGVHAFHALWWQRLAQQCWDDTLTFLRPYLGGSAFKVAQASAGRAPT